MINEIDKKTVEQTEIDRALLILTDTVRKINNYLSTYSDDTENDLFNKMSDARSQVDEIANETRILFIECLKRCIDGKKIIPQPTIKWERDEYNNITKVNTYQNRPPCEICGEARKVEFCHIIPRQIGGSNRETNIMYLCSTHHSCFDKGVLSKEEWDSISWDGRSEITKSFVTEVFKARQEDHWKGNRVVADIVYYSYKPLRDWIKKYLGCDSTDEWRKKRKTKSMIRNGTSYLG